ncbi:4Fe-4S dicluster domain-containing protein [Mycobacterium haemophilum]|uniref:Ferredoxin n=1 Tax=Mycobacterium haemophilum TaxID=29311 RepID=A0A0I9U9W1_9MYCO|nr:hypothetical protein [Mycobacterium haemophilum]KLO33474.1 ferredoxin [Mycobacterium haemophilum]KLO38999.1 ferredoxin [Mycobacterium haemophilum]KLO45415.1 ferredoxin [Mycobacterium haemophilum]KLO56565.1 ferredoxin [Mycobacterium haemophilum]
MTYVIGKPCVDVLDRACVEVCPVEAIYYEDDLPEDLQPYLADNEAFFAQRLPGRDEPLGSPGGAAKIGPLGVDTPLVASLPKRDAQGE